MNITFKHIYNSGIIIYEDELIIHRQDQGILLRYDSNFIEFKIMPSVQQLLKYINYLTKFHEQYGQKFIKLKFPPNEVIPKSLLEQLEQFSIGFLELYTILPEAFQSVGTQADIRNVEEPQLEDFLTLQYNEDLHFGQDYAKQKQGFLLREREKAGHLQIIAYKNNTPVGSVELIETDATIEIDNFFVISTMRGQGIGSAIQHFVMNYAKGKLVILVADGEDDARTMYQKQGYKLKGFQYEAIRQFEQ